MNVSNKLKKKSMKIIITMMLALVFFIGEVFSQFATLAYADSYKMITVIVKDADTGQRISGANVTFNGPGGSGDTYSGTSGSYGTCYINVHNGSEKKIGVTVNKDGYNVWNIYDSYYNYVKSGIQKNDLVVKGWWIDYHTITIELKKNTTTNNTTTSTIGSKPQFTVTMDSYTPTNPTVGGEITFTGTIHPQDFQIPIQTKEIVLVLDSSGSMAGTKIEKLKDAAKKFIQKMQGVSNLKIGIVDFDTQAVCGYSGYSGYYSTGEAGDGSYGSKLIDASNVDVLTSTINNLKAGGGTNTGEGLREAAYLLSSSSEQSSTSSKTIVFMSDGEPTYYNWQRGWTQNDYNGKYYKYYDKWGNFLYNSDFDSNNMINGNEYSYKTGPYDGDYYGWKYQNGYYTNITKSSFDSNVTRGGDGTAGSDTNNYSLNYATTMGAIIKSKGYNVFSIGYGLDTSGTAKMHQIHDSMSSVSDNFFESDTDSIESIFDSIGNTVLNTYPITGVKFNFNPNANSSIISVDGSTISLPDFNYKKVDSASSSSTIKYTADPVSFTVKVKSNIAGNNIPVFTNSTSTLTSTVTFPWKSETISANVPVKYINVGNIDTIPPVLTLTPSTTNSSESVEITASATDNVAVASITTPDNNLVSFTPAVSNSTTYTATMNGEYTFKVTDTAGNVTTATININNIVSANVASKPKFTVTMDPSYSPTNPGVNDEITFNGTIHPEDFQISIPQKEIVLVLDSSGSMGSNLKLYNLKIAAKNFIKRMKDVKNLKIGIVDFDTQSLCGSNLIDASNVTALNSAIDNLYAGGGTNTGEGLRLGAYLLSNSGNNDASKTIVFMSDGEPTYYNWKDNKYYTAITQQSIDSSVQRKGTGSSDTNGYCLDYAKTMGAIIKQKGYNAFSIGYGLDSSGNAKMQQIHNSMSSVSDNFFQSDTGSIDSVFNSIADTILDTYRITDVKFNFNGGTNSNIVSVDGDLISLPGFNYTISSQTSSTVKYTAEPVPFTMKIKSTKEGRDIRVFTNSTVTFPWKSEIIEGKVPEQGINIGSDADSTSPALTLTPSTTDPTNQDVVITASATDNVAVASIKTPDNNIVEFNPALPSNSTTYTVSANGTYTFVATDTAGSKTEKSIIISNIDKIPPVITIGEYNTNPTNQDITVTATTNEGTLNSDSHVFTENGSYTFTATDSVGNTASVTVTITNIDKIPPSAPMITLNSDGKVTIIPGDDNVGGSGVKEVKYQVYSGTTAADNQDWISYGDSFDFDSSVFTVKAKTIDNAGNESEAVTQTFSESESVIEKHGIYDPSTDGHIKESNLNVVNGVSTQLAILVNARYSNPIINLNIGDTNKITNESIDVKLYAYSTNTIGTLKYEKTLTINNGTISMDSSEDEGFKMEKGNKYLIVYTITPKKTNDDNDDDNVTLTAKVQGTSDSKPRTLNIQDLPDLF